MGYVKIISAILIWSSLGIFVKKIDMPTSGVIFYPAAVAFLLQLAILTFTRQPGKTTASKTTPRKVLLLLSIPLSFLMNSYLFYFAFRNTTVANAVLTHYSAPVFVALLAPLFLKEKIFRTTWFAIILSSLGLWFMMGIPAADSEIFTGSNDTLGMIAGTLSGLAYALLIIVIRSIAGDFSSLFIILIQNGIVALMLLPFILHITVTSASLPYLLTLGIVHSTLAPFLYVQGFRSVKAHEAAILGYAEPVGAIILAFIFLREVPGLASLFGGSLILYSGFLILRARGQ